MAQAARLDKAATSGAGRQNRQRRAELVAARRTRDVVAMLSMISAGELGGSWAPSQMRPTRKTTP